MSRVRGCPRFLCLLIAASAACALFSREAEAKGCTDHLLTSVYSSQSRPSDIPKTRRISARKKLHAPTATARAVPKPAAIVHVHVNEKPYDPDFVEDLEIESLTFDLMLDDPRRIAIPKLSYFPLELGAIETPAPLLVVADASLARPAFHAPMPLRI